MIVVFVNLLISRVLLHDYLCGHVLLDIYLIAFVVYAMSRLVVVNHDCCQGDGTDQNQKFSNLTLGLFGWSHLT